MKSIDDVRHLAALARIEVGPKELEVRAKEFEQILAYVNQLETLAIPKGRASAPILKNVFREDGPPDPSGVWTAKLVAQFPQKKGDALSVRQVITHE